MSNPDNPTPDSTATPVPPASGTSGLAALRGGGIRAFMRSESGPIASAFIATILLFAIGALVKSGFAGWSSISNIVLIASFVGLVAAGQMFVILVGGIDLSVPWVITAAGLVLTTQAAGSNGKLLTAIPLALLVGVLAGLVSGAGVAYLGVPAVVMTLGINGILQGLVLGLSKGMTCATCSAPAPGRISSLVSGKAFGFLPGGILIWVVVLIVVAFVLRRTVFGRQVYAVGNSPLASALSTVNVRLVTMLLYVLSGLFAALGGVVLTGFGGQATLGMGDPYLFQSISAVVVGGVYILGGRGRYLGVVGGALVLTVLQSFLTALSQPEWTRDVVFGGVVLAILLIYGRGPKEDL